MWEVFSFGSMPYPGLTNSQAADKINEGFKCCSFHSVITRYRSLKHILFLLNDAERKIELELGFL